jgi:hypothetical protein
MLILEVGQQSKWTNWNYEFVQDAEEREYLDITGRKWGEAAEDWKMSFVIC